MHTIHSNFKNEAERATIIKHDIAVAATYICGMSKQLSAYNMHK